MAEPLSVAAGIVGITVPALHGTKLLLNDLQQLKDAPKTVRRLTEDVHSAETALKLLHGVEDREWKLLGTIVAEESKTTISSCTQACEQFRPQLQRWTRHSEDGKMAWRDRTNVGFFKQNQIKAMSEQLQNCKLTINTIVTIATLYNSVRHSQITEDIKQTISSTQAEVKGAITVTKKQLNVLEDRMDELNLSSDEEEATRSEENKSEALRQLEEEHKAIKASQKLLDELLSKAQEEAVARAAVQNHGSSPTVTFGHHNSGFQTGVINGAVSGLSFGRK